MADKAHEWTDEQIDRLRERLRAAYAQAEEEMHDKLARFLETYDTMNREWQRRVSNGEATEEQYRRWRQNMASDRAFLQGMIGMLSESAANVDRMAMDMVNGELPQIYAENANMAAFEVESALGKNTHSFDLVDVDTVRFLMEDPDLLPEVRQPQFDNGVDIRWNRQKFTGAITQSILQGESIPHAADRISRVMRMNESSAVRAARTAITSAENAGRVMSYKRAEAIGIKLEQQWVATLDNRTRHSHRMVDGQHVPVGEKFDVDGQPMEYPGDPNAPGEYVYNCRCTLVAWFPDIEQEDPERWSDLPAGMTYEGWKAGKGNGS